VVALGTGLGSFGSPVHYSTGAGPSAVVAGDLNGDGTDHFSVAIADVEMDGAPSLDLLSFAPAGLIVLPNQMQDVDEDDDGIADAIDNCPTATSTPSAISATTAGGLQPGAG
jgi:hypothetical protein